MIELRTLPNAFSKLVCKCKQGNRAEHQRCPARTRTGQVLTRSDDGVIEPRPLQRFLGTLLPEQHAPQQIQWEERLVGPHTCHQHHLWPAQLPSTYLLGESDWSFLKSMFCLEDDRRFILYFHYFNFTELQNLAHAVCHSGIANMTCLGPRWFPL